MNDSKFISEIETFSLDYNHYPLRNYGSSVESIQTFISSLPSLSTSIKHIDFGSSKKEFYDLFANILQSQSQLRSVKIKTPTHPKVYLFPLLDSLKYFSNTITSINFCLYTFSDIISVDALSYLTQLESLQLFNLYSILLPH